MNKFSKWTALAHSTLAKSHPKLKLNQVRECLAAWLGHRTYASLLAQDLDALLAATKYAIIDTQAAINRANHLGFPVTSEQWRGVEMVLSPSGISGMWLIGMGSMHSAAQLTFEDQYHPDIDSIKQHLMGITNGRWSTSSVCHSPEDSHPNELMFTVHGEVPTFSEHDTLAVPVVAEVLFKRVGVRLYAAGEILTVAKMGPPHPYEQEEEFVTEFYGNFDD